MQLVCLWPMKNISSRIFLIKIILRFIIIGEQQAHTAKIYAAADDACDAAAAAAGPPLFAQNDAQFAPHHLPCRMDESEM